MEIFKNQILNKCLPGLYAAQDVDGNEDFGVDGNMQEICWS